MILDTMTYSIMTVVVVLSIVVILLASTPEKPVTLQQKYRSANHH